MRLCVAIDCMGGDHGPHVTVPAALDFLKDHPEACVILVGLSDAIQVELGKLGASADARVAVRHASEIVAMDEAPALAMRGKKDSSMRVAIDLVKDGQAHACVSAGNTGALMAISRFVLKMLPGIDRPAIVSAVPAVHGHTVMLDLGANPECSADNLVQFAVMGAVIAADLHGVANPRVGLLNIGEEDIKGTEEIKAAHKRLTGSALNYCGFVEGDKIFSGDIDVVVTLIWVEKLILVLLVYSRRPYQFYTRQKS